MTTNPVAAAWRRQGRPGPDGLAGHDLLASPLDDRFSARRGTCRVIYRIDDTTQVVTAVDVAPAVTPSEREQQHPARALPNYH